MIEDIKAEARERMAKSLGALAQNFNRIRTGRAHPHLLDGIRLDYYGADTPLNQMANISADGARTLLVTAWDRTMTPKIEKAILKSGLGLNPVTAGDVIRIPMPALTQETRRDYIKQAKQETESARVSVRTARRDALDMLKELVKDKDISEDEERRGHEAVQKITDSFIAEVEKMLAEKESDLLEI